MAPAPSCRTCVHGTRMGTCAEPAAAGLADRFVIVWPPAGHASRCAAHAARPSTPRETGAFVVIVSPAVANPVRDLPHQPPFQAAIWSDRHPAPAFPP